MIRPVLIAVIGGGISLFAAACGRQPGPFAVPPQDSLDLGADPTEPNAYITMDDPASDEYVVRDISPARASHRWAFKHPEMRFRVGDGSYSRFAVEFAIVEATYNGTGPVTVSAAVDGTSLGSIRCDHPGDYRMEKPLPAGLLVPGKEVHVTFEARPRWVSPADGAELSFYLRSAGFIR